MDILATTVRTDRKVSLEGVKGKLSPFVLERCDYCHYPLKKCHCRCTDGCG